MVNIPDNSGFAQAFANTLILNPDGTYTLRVSGTSGTAGVGSQSIAFPITITGVSSVSLAFPISVTPASSQSVFISGQAQPLSASLAYPITTTSTGTTSNSLAFPVTLTQPQTVVATNFGTRPLRSDSDTVTVANVIGDVKGTNFGIRPLNSVSDSVTTIQSGISSASLAYPISFTGIQSNSLAFPASVLSHPVTATNLGIRPLTSQSDTITVTSMIGDVHGTNFGIRPLTSASDSVTAVQSGSWAVATPPGSYDQNAHLVVTADTYTQKVDYDSSNNPIYVGWALPGTSQSTSTWRLEQIVYSNSTGTFNPVDVRWANGNPLFTNAWTNRLSTSFL